jgi:nucleoside-diphosphate-sugar epimerase
MLNFHTELHIGNLLPKRDFTYVDDTVSGFIEIYKSQNLFGEVTNIGMNKNISVKDLTNIIAGILDLEIEFQVEHNRIRPGRSEVMNLLCNNNKILSGTNWEPQYDLNSGLLKTIEWIKQNLSYYKNNIYNI